MPLVEFACAGCGERVEKLVRATSDAPAPPCPACGGEMRRLLAACNVAGGGAGTGAGGGCSAGHAHGFS